MSDELGPNHLRGGASDFVTSTKPTVPTRASRLRTPGKPGSIARKPHTKADPPIRHPNGKLQWLHGSSSWPSPEPSIGLMVLANQEHPADFEPQRNVLRRKTTVDRPHLMHVEECFCLPGTPGLLGPVNRYQRSQLAWWTSSPVDSPTDLSEESSFGFPTSTLENLSDDPPT
jgi:hypothetical protein